MCLHSEYTYVVHLEAINCLLVLLSVQLFSQTAAEYSVIYRIAMHTKYRDHVPPLVCTLLNNFVQQEHAPPGLLTHHPGGSIVFSIAGTVSIHFKTILTIDTKMLQKHRWLIHETIHGLILTHFSGIMERFNFENRQYFKKCSSCKQRYYGRGWEKTWYRNTTRQSIITPLTSFDESLYHHSEPISKCTFYFHRNVW